MTNRKTNTNIGGTMDAMTFDELDAIIDQVKAHADLEWLRVARDVVQRLAMSGVDFTGDDAWLILDELPVATSTPSALGAVFRDLQREGVIIKTGEMRMSRRRQAHRMKTVWRGAR
jgi:hypothetical protein